MQCYELFIALYESLVEYGIELTSSGTKPKFRLIDEFLMVMMRLRLGLLVKDLHVEYRFKVSPSTVSITFGKWITFMANVMKSLVFYHLLMF